MSLVISIPTKFGISIGADSMQTIMSDNVPISDLTEFLQLNKDKPIIPERLLSAFYQNNLVRSKVEKQVSQRKIWPLYLHKNTHWGCATIVGDVRKGKIDLTDFLRAQGNKTISKEWATVDFFSNSFVDNLNEFLNIKRNGPYIGEYRIHVYLFNPLSKKYHSFLVGPNTNSRDRAPICLDKRTHLKEMDLHAEGQSFVFDRLILGMEHRRWHTARYYIDRVYRKHMFEAFITSKSNLKEIVQEGNQLFDSLESIAETNSEVAQIVEQWDSWKDKIDAEKKFFSVRDIQHIYKEKGLTLNEQVFQDFLSEFELTNAEEKIIPEEYVQLMLHFQEAEKEASNEASKIVRGDTAINVEDLSLRESFRLIEFAIQTTEKAFRYFTMKPEYVGGDIYYAHISEKGFQNITNVDEVF